MENGSSFTLARSRTLNDHVVMLFSKGTALSLQRHITSSIMYPSSDLFVALSSCILVVALEVSRRPGEYRMLYSSEKFRKEALSPI